jgi:hypothetical protein
MIGFINAFFVKSLLITINTVLPLIYTFQYTIAHALGFLVSTSRILAMDLNTGTITSNHYEVFLSFLLHSPWIANSPELNQILKFCISLVCCIPIPLVLDSVLCAPILHCPQRSSVSVISLRHRPHRKHLSSTDACVFTATLPSTGHPTVVYSLLWDVFTGPLPSIGWPSIVGHALVGTCLLSHCLAMRHKMNKRKKKTHVFTC